MNSRNFNRNFYFGPRFKEDANCITHDCFLERAVEEFIRTLRQNSLVVKAVGGTRLWVYQQILNEYDIACKITCIQYILILPIKLAKDSDLSVSYHLFSWLYRLQWQANSRILNFKIIYLRAIFN